MSLCCRSKRFRAAGLGGSSGSALQVRQNEIEKKAPLKLALRKRERIERERDGGGDDYSCAFRPPKGDRLGFCRVARKAQVLSRSLADG